MTMLVTIKSSTHSRKEYLVYTDDATIRGTTLHVQARNGEVVKVPNSPVITSAFQITGSIKPETKDEILQVLKALNPR